MPKPRLPYLHKERTRHKRTVYYFRRPGGARIRVHGEYMSQEFVESYQQAAKGGTPEQRIPQKVGKTTLEWLIRSYMQSSPWAALKDATQRQRWNIFKHVIAQDGDQPYRALDKGDIVAGRDKRHKTPNQANNFIKSMRGLFQWALEAGYVDVDPTQGVKMTVIQTDGYHTWTEAEVAKFEKVYPLGTRERVWFDVLLYTGLRRGDACRLGPENVVDGVFTIKAEKNGYEVVVPILPILAKTLAAGPVGKTTFIAGQRGNPLAKAAFGNLFREACRKAEVPGGAHGLRKAAATRAAEAGATESELRAIFGWANDDMPSLYTKKASRGRLAASGMAKLGTVRASGNNPKRTQGDETE